MGKERRFYVSVVNVGVALRTRKVGLGRGERKSPPLQPAPSAVIDVCARSRRHPVTNQPASIIAETATTPDLATILASRRFPSSSTSRSNSTIIIIVHQDSSRRKPDEIFWLVP
nr:hypothetical protein Itr_chr14CG17770 [Ipomoea trifida]